MSAGKQRSRQAPSLEAAGPERLTVVLDEFRADLAFWIGTQPRTAQRIMRLVEEILRSPYTGTGKPEPLRHDRKGRWSRRITDEHRLVYYLTSVGTFFSEARTHYSR